MTNIDVPYLCKVAFWQAWGAIAYHHTALPDDLFSHEIDHAGGAADYAGE